MVKYCCVPLCGRFGGYKFPSDEGFQLKWGGGNKADGQENKKSYGISVKKTSCAMHTFPSMTPLNQGSKPILSVKIYRQFF